MSVLLRSHGMGFAALALGISVFLSRILGLVRDKIISYYFGTGVEADVYFTAFVIPDFLSYLLAGGYFSITLVPLLATLFLENEREGWRFFSVAVQWAFIAIATLSAIAWYFAEELAVLVAPGFSVEATERLVIFLRIILPAQVFFLPGSCFTAMLYYRKQFTIPALTPLIYNGAIIISGVLSIIFFPEQGMEGFCWGVTIGAFFGSFLLPLWGVARGGLQFFLLLSHPAMKKLLFLALPLMLGQSISSLDEQFVRIFGSLADEGSVSLLSYARRIMHVPVGVIAQAAGLASFPFLASLVAKRDWDGVNKNLHSTTSAAILIALPVSCWMMLEAIPTMRLIFQQGNFTASNAHDSGILLMIMLSSVLFWTLQQILARAFYAYQDTLTPTLAGTAATIVCLPLYWITTKEWGAVGVALTGVTAIGLYTILLLVCWGRRFGMAAFQGLHKEMCLCLLVCTPAVAAAYGAGVIAQPIFAPLGLWGVTCHLALSGTIFAAIYFGACLVFFPSLCAPLLVFIYKLLRKCA